MAFGIVCSRNGTPCWVHPALAILLFVALSAGGALAGTWTTYTEARFISGLDIEGTDLWAGTNGGVLQWDLVSESYQKMTTVDGLVEHRVKDVLVDSDGIKWFGTTQGVQTYDGSTWTTYDTSNSPLPHNWVFALAQDHDGAIWIGTGYGCARYDGGTWEVFTDLGGGATNVAVRGIGVDSLNRIWTANNPDDWGSPGGVSMYDGAVWTRHDPDPGSIGQYYLSLTVDNADNVWAGTWTNWVFQYNGSTWTHFTSSNSGLVGQNIEAFTVDDNGAVWIANHTPSATAATNGIAKFDGANWTSYTSANSGLPFSFVYALVATGGTIYCGTANHGIAGFSGFAWDYYETQNEPHTNWITSIEQGTVGGNTLLHYGTHHAGIALFDGADWSSYTTDNSGLGDNYINDVHVSDGVLWAGAQFTGVWFYDGSSWQNYNTGNSDMLGDIVLSVATDSQGDLWMGTAGWDGPEFQVGAVTRYNGTTWTNYYLSNSGLIDDHGLQVAVDPTDTIWIGTEAGVSKFDGVSTWTDYDSGNSGLIENHVQAIAFGATGETWFATLGGVSCFDGATWTSYTTTDGLPSNAIKDIAVSGDDVWVATAAGAAVSRAGARWEAYTPADGIADEDVRAVCIENNDAVWFGTYRSGISVFVDQPTGVENPVVHVAGSLLRQNFPNPFNPSTTISYDLREPARVSLTVFDVSGRLMRRLVTGASMSAGNHRVVWDGRNSIGVPVASGVYFYRLDAGSYSETCRMVLAK